MQPSNSNEVENQLNKIFKKEDFLTKNDKIEVSKKALLLKRLLILFIVLAVSLPFISTRNLAVVSPSKSSNATLTSTKSNFNFNFNQQIF